MHPNKTIGLCMILICCGTAVAWTDEVGVAENETLVVDFNPIMNASSADNPYDFLDSDITNTPFFEDTYISNHQITLNYVYVIYKQIWDASSGTYTQTDCNVTIETSVTLSWDSTIEQYVLPKTFNNDMTNGFMVKKYFQELINSDSQYCSEFNTTDETDKPDVFYTAIDIDVGDGTTHTGEMYVAIDDRAAEDLSSAETPYGFAMGGRGSGGGSGSIYEGLDMYGSGGEGDTSGMGGAFDVMFFMIIPLLFLLCIAKMVGKVW